ncbi:unnamed protein product [Ilex paraguariensis]|uniref:Uncharacterized protein n=1 Tax=Ilex paraguariensis TaxID=185542 RepID=A0ABC8RLL4_9AQUA
MTGRKKYRPKVVDTSEKMKRKKSCNDPPSSSSKKKCNHPSSMDPTVDPTSFNPVDLTVNHPPSSSNPICNEEISFFNKHCKLWYENYINYRPLLLERGVLLDQLKEVGCDVIFSLHQWNSTVDIKKTDKAYNTLVKIFYSNMHDIDRDDYKFKSLVRKIMEDCGVVIHSSDTYSTPMNPIYGGTIKKSLGQRKKNKTQQPQPQVENEVEVEDDEAQTQDVPNSSTIGVLNSSTTGVPNSSTTGLPLDALQNGAGALLQSVLCTGAVY